jgi:hypothetical protein
MSCHAHTPHKRVVCCFGPKGATGPQGATGPATGTPQRIQENSGNFVECANSDITIQPANQLILNLGPCQTGYVLTATDANGSCAWGQNTANELIRNNSDQTTRVKCYDAGYIAAESGGVSRMVIESDGNTLLTTGTGASANRLDMNTSKVALFFGTTPVLLAQGSATTLRSLDGSKRIDINATGVRIQNAYYLPNTVGTAGQILTSNGAGVSTWTTPAGLFGLYSQTGISTVTGDAEEYFTTMANGVGTLTIPVNSIIPGTCFLYRTGGTFTTVVASQFFEFKFYSNNLVLFDSGEINVPIGNNIAWTIDMTFTYLGNSNLVSNFNFRYQGTNYTGQNMYTSFSTLNDNVLEFTWRWKQTGSSMSCNFGIITRLYQ